MEPAEKLFDLSVVRIICTDLPLYFAVISRVRVESRTLGPAGGILSSSVVPQAKLVFPQDAIIKPIRVGLQVGYTTEHTYASCLFLVAKFQFHLFWRSKSTSFRQEEEKRRYLFCSKTNNSNPWQFRSLDIEPGCQKTLWSTVLDTKTQAIQKLTKHSSRFYKTKTKKLKTKCTRRLKS